MADAVPHAVVVGFGPGVGEATARAFAASGYRLSLIARDGAKLDAAVQIFRNEGLSAAGFAGDAGDEVALETALAAATAAAGDPDVLLYNAAHWRPGPLLALTPDALVADFRVCAAGALLAARMVVPAMMARGRGTLLFTGGGFALYPSPAAPALSIGKASIRALALMLAQELAPAGLRVGTVTIMGTVTPGTALDPARIAEAFMALHHGPVDPATAETRLGPT